MLATLCESFPPQRQCFQGSQDKHEQKSAGCRRWQLERILERIKLTTFVNVVLILLDIFYKNSMDRITKLETIFYDFFSLQQAHMANGSSSTRVLRPLVFGGMGAQRISEEGECGEISNTVSKFGCSNHTI